MGWKTAYRSFYYVTAEEPDDINLDPETTALLVIDIQNTYLEDKETPEETARWGPFYDRMRSTVIPNTARLIAECRERGVEVVFARIACHKGDAVEWIARDVAHRSSHAQAVQAGDQGSREVEARGARAEVCLAIHHALPALGAYGQFRCRRFVHCH